MTLKSDAKFKEKLTFSFKYHIKNLVNFHPNTQKSENFTSIWTPFVESMSVWDKKNTEELSFVTLDSDTKFE